MRPFRLGLTGSIGMGKSTTSAFFEQAGLPVWDADAAVHRLYSKGGSAVAAMSAEWPSAVVGGVVDRGALKAIIATDPSSLARIEAIVHPLVAEDRLHFLSNATSDIVVLDIPLLFEKGTEADMDATLVVTAPPHVQRARVLARPGMTEVQFQTILARQMPDSEKRSKATHIVETLSLASVQAYITALIEHIRENGHA